MELGYQIQSDTGKQVGNVSFWFWIMACHVPKLYNWDAQLNGCPGFHNQIWSLFILEVGIISGLLNKQFICGKRMEEEAAGAFCLKTKDANHVNTTWPSGSQEEIKISDALSGGCQIEQLKGIIAPTHGKQSTGERKHTHTHANKTTGSECAFCIPHCSTPGGFSLLFTRLVTSP